ncbi:MAG: hypothetical protein M9962_11105 [Oligoflexia bacterium]|nr:hypothetical protein [Oligoflexia bacterium]
MTNYILLILFPIISKAEIGKKISCDETKSQVVRVQMNRVLTLNFLSPPKDAIPGESGFDIKCIQNDLVIKSIKTGANTNLIVYLENRRCFFHLISSLKGDESLFVRDKKDTSIEVKYEK